MRLTPQVVRDVQAIVAKYTGVAGIVLYGTEGADPAALELATKLGLIDRANPNPGMASLMHVFGAYMATVGDAAVNMPLAKFRELMARHKLPQTEQERESADYIRTRGTLAMTNASARLSSQAAASVIDVIRQRYLDLRGAVRDVLAAKVGDEEAAQRIEDAAPGGFFGDGWRQTIDDAVSDLGHLTGLWRRDLKRIIHTEMTGATQAGQVARWEAAAEEEAETTGSAPRELLVYKVTRIGACPHCLRLHEDSGDPRVYKMIEAVANGTNVGRRARDWRFVVGPVHPWCACQLMRLPNWISMPDGWSSGDAAPTVIGPGGRLVVP